MPKQKWSFLKCSNLKELASCETSLWHWMSPDNVLPWCNSIPNSKSNMKMWILPLCLICTVIQMGHQHFTPKSRFRLEPWSRHNKIHCKGMSWAMKNVFVAKWCAKQDASMMFTTGLSVESWEILSKGSLLFVWLTFSQTWNFCSQCFLCHFVLKSNDDCMNFPLIEKLINFDGKKMCSPI